MRQSDGASPDRGEQRGVVRLVRTAQKNNKYFGNRLTRTVKF